MNSHLSFESVHQTNVQQAILSKTSFEISLLNFPSKVTDISPVSSDTTTVKASETSEIPTAALCLVPKLFDIFNTI